MSFGNANFPSDTQMQSSSHRRFGYNLPKALKAWLKNVMDKAKIFLQKMGEDLKTYQCGAIVFGKLSEDSLKFAVANLCNRSSIQ